MDGGTFPYSIKSLSFLLLKDYKLYAMFSGRRVKAGGSERGSAGADLFTICINYVDDESTVSRVRRRSSGWCFSD